MKVRHIKRRSFDMRPPWITIQIPDGYVGGPLGEELIKMTRAWVGDDGHVRFEIERAVHSPKPLT